MERTYKDEISTIVREYGSLYDDGYDVLARGNNVVADITKKRFKLHLTMNNPAQLSTEITLTRKKPYSFTSKGTTYPKLPLLKKEQLKKVDDIFKREADLWMLTSMNNRAIHYDISKGYESIAKQKLIYFHSHENENQEVEIKGLYNKPFAVIYYKVKHSNDLAIWINLDTQEVSGASWLEIPQNNGGLIPKEDFSFINKALKKNGSFGVYGNVTQGLPSLIKHYDVNINGLNDSKEYFISVNPKNGHGHFLKFTITKSNGKISSPLAGNRIAPRSPSDLGIK